MGFWARDRMDQLGVPEYSGADLVVEATTVPCGECGLVFESYAELAVHRFGGHFSRRPVILAGGRELGASRLIVTRATAPEDWIFHSTERIEINGRRLSARQAAGHLAKQSSGVFDITAFGNGEQRLAQVEFALPTEADLDGVDAALHHLIAGHELSRRSIIGFVERGRPYDTARRYLDGLASYLFGVLARDDVADAGMKHRGSLEAYSARYDSAVTELKKYDRPAAEAICGLVAFHYNHFSLAMRRTRSPLVSAVALRISEILRVHAPTQPGTFELDGASALDLALSDSATERVLLASAASLHAPWEPAVAEIFDHMAMEQPYDQLKLRVLAAEHALGFGRREEARELAEPLRHERITENWYMNVRSRLESE